MGSKSPKTVEEYISGHSDWKEALVILRDIMLETGMDEAIKWSRPTYSYEGKNVVGVSAFQSHVGVWFFHGALLDDKDSKLVNAQPGKTKALRQWRFQSLDEIVSEKETIRSYVEEALENQKRGREVKIESREKLKLPEELVALFAINEKVEQAFNELSMAKQREYAHYISEAKRASTRQRRLTKIVPLIEKGVGLNHKYKT